MFQGFFPGRAGGKGQVLSDIALGVVLPDIEPAASVHDIAGHAVGDIGLFHLAAAHPLDLVPLAEVDAPGRMDIQDEVVLHPHAQDAVVSEDAPIAVVTVDVVDIVVADDRPGILGPDIDGARIDQHPHRLAAERFRHIDFIVLHGRFTLDRLSPWCHAPFHRHLGHLFLLHRCLSCHGLCCGGGQRRQHTGMCRHGSGGHRALGGRCLSAIITTLFRCRQHRQRTVGRLHLFLFLFFHRSLSRRLGGCLFLGRKDYLRLYRRRSHPCHQTYKNPFFHILLILLFRVKRVVPVPVFVPVIVIVSVNVIVL